MLPDDTAARRDKMAAQNVRQSNVTDHFKPATEEDKPKPYSDELFKEAAIQWLVETNQVGSFSSPSSHTSNTISASPFRLSTIHRSNG